MVLAREPNRHSREDYPTASGSDTFVDYLANCDAVYRTKSVLGRNDLCIVGCRSSGDHIVEFFVGLGELDKVLCSCSMDSVDNIPAFVDALPKTTKPLIRPTMATIVLVTRQ